MRPVMRTAHLDEHPDDNPEKAANLRHLCLILSERPGQMVSWWNYHTAADGLTLHHMSDLTYGAD